MTSVGCGDPESPGVVETDVGTSGGLAGSSSSSGVVESSSADESSTGLAPGVPPPARPSEQTCRFEGAAPGQLPELLLDAAFPLDRDDITSLAVDADTQHAFVGTGGGEVVRVSLTDGSVSTAIEAADLSAVAGLTLGRGPAGPALFVRLEGSQGSANTSVRRYDLAEDGTVQVETLVRVIRLVHPADVRTGAGLTFTSDDELVIPLGDWEAGSIDGAAGDPSTRPGSVLRLDVSTLDTDYDYAIPEDNPFVRQPAPADAAYAVGMRDPIGCAVDAESDLLWCADAGEFASETTVVGRGDDLGWPSLEATDCRLPSGDCYQLDTVAPTTSYRHSPEQCGAVGGSVYLGDHPTLRGAYVFGDRCDGTVRAVRIEPDGTGRVRAVVGAWDVPPAAFSTDADGVMWAVDAQGVLGRVEPLDTAGSFPVELAHSGCFTAGADRLEAPDLVPYELNAPLWTDDAIKQRHIVLPPGATIDIADDGTFSFPEGTILLKTFSFEFVEGDPQSVRPVETRVMYRRNFGWQFHSYQWNETGDAAQVLDERANVFLQLERDGETAELEYTFPSRDECGYCHGSGGGQVLGPQLAQFDRMTDYGTGPISQLEALEAIGMFTTPPVLPEQPLVSPDDDAQSLQDRARSYLHANCSHCHRPGGWAPPGIGMDLRWATSLDEAAICDVDIRYYAPWFEATKRIAPGDPDDSLIWQRLSTRGPGQMPPLATFIVDPGADAVRQWIESFDDCAASSG